MATVLLRRATKPAATVARSATVIDAVRVMAERKVGAVIIAENGVPEGIFTERDVMMKVVLKGLDATKAKVADVMTSPILPIDVEASIEDALELMLERHIRHLPVLDKDGKVQGIVSMRYLMQDKIDKLNSEVAAIEAYAGLDSVGG